MSPVKRIEKRRHLYIYLKVQDTHSGMELGRLANLTSNGLLMVGKKKYESGESIDVTIDLEGLEINSPLQKIDVHVTTRWSRQDVNPDYFVTGFSMETPDIITGNAIDFVIETIGFKD